MMGENVAPRLCLAWLAVQAATFFWRQNTGGWEHSFGDCVSSRAGCGGKATFGATAMTNLRGKAWGVKKKGTGVRGRFAKLGR